MPYVERTTVAGKVIEVDRYYTSRYHKKGIQRGDKVKATNEAQKKVNTRKAERNLRILLNANFQDGDLHINMGYVRKNGEESRTREEMKKDASVFLRELRKQYKKEGRVLKYVHVMETGEKGARHHHLVINYIDSRKIQAAWKKAYSGGSTVHISPLNTNGDYSKLAAYLIKYTDKTVGTEKALQGKRWNCSRNLFRPVPVYKIIKTANEYYTTPRAKKGYYVDKKSIAVGVHCEDFYGYGFFSYRMIKIE